MQCPRACGEKDVLNCEGSSTAGYPFANIVCRCFARRLCANVILELTLAHIAHWTAATAYYPVQAGSYGQEPACQVGGANMRATTGSTPPLACSLSWDQERFSRTWLG